MSDERRIGDLLVDAGVISRDALESALKRKPLVGGHRLVSELYDLGLANERQLAEVLAKKLGVPVAVLTESVVDLTVVRLVPAEVMRKHLALPILADERSVTVVTPDPDAPGLLVPLGFATGRRVVPLIGIHAILERLIEDALKAIEEGENVLIGAKAQGGPPHVAVAKFAPRIGIEEANELAKKIVEALADPPASSSSGSTAGKPVIGALRLKQMVIERRPEHETPIIDEKIPELVPVEPSTPEKPPVVLVVDDDAGIRTLISKALTHDGILVKEAKNGEEAVTLLRVMRPSLIVLDAMLPLIHGFEICASLKRSQLKSIPVVMISAVYRGWEQAREIQEVHGADYFIEKPFELTYVRKLVAELLGREASAPPRVDGAQERVEELRRRYEESANAGLYFSADAIVEQWIDLDPFDGRAWLERGNLCAHSGDLVGAMSAYEAAVVYDPALVVAHLGLAMAYEQLGFVKRARQTWLRARELAPDDALRARIDAHLASG